ncbi:MAG: HEAT repeat domain-containing protein, partial [Myxococcota bacterium]
GRKPGLHSPGQPGPATDRLARGSEGQVYGPFDEAEIATREGEVIAALEGEGFVQTPNGELLQRLAGASAKDRALAALRLGWRGAEEAIPRLIALTESPGEELCSVLDALGMIGNESAIAAVRPFAARKLLSRRRSAVEALIRLEDHETLAAVRDREHARLPLNVQEALAGEDGAAIADAVLSAEAKKRGVSLDVLYERNEAHCTAAVRRAVLKLDLTHPSIWRYAKSVFKRSMLRGDAKTFGLFAYRCERAGITGGAVHTVKSGYDGKSRPMPILSRKTSNKMRSAGWRYLRDVAQWRPEAYTLFASEVLLHYRDSDGIKPERRAGAFADCFYFNRILYGNGDRLEVDWRSLRHRFKNAQSVHPSGSREEPFAELWDSTPRPFLRLATRARHLEVQRFALAGLVRHPEVLHEATVEALLRLLNVPLPTAAPLVVAELERRFDPRAPDWSLVEILLGRDEEPVIELLIRWLDETRDQWCPVPERVARFLESKAVSVQRRVAAWVNEAPYPEGSAVPLMELLRAKLSGPESTEGSSAAIASVLAGTLRSTLLAHTDLEFDLALIADGSPT